MRAAQYVRMSTDRQDFSIANQLAAIQTYALLHEFEIVRTYADPGKSGVDLAHRPGLQQLLSDVTKVSPGFQAILVYDITRWGRFQDIDESAYHEFVCKRAGIQVHYCAEPFASGDPGLMAALLKAIKRVMAGEYVRELSAKTFAGQCRLARNGFKLGGTPGYGLRRLLISREGSTKQLLADGEAKSLASDRVVYALGPANEVAVVRQIYSWFLNDGASAELIAKMLCERGIPRKPFGPWDKYAVNAILNHPKYCGSVVFNRTSKKLGARFTRNPQDQWIVTPDSFEAIIPPAQFQEVRRRRKPMCHRSDGEFIDDLEKVWKLHGKLTAKTISSTPGVPSPQTYLHHFGSLGKAYEQLGHVPTHGYFGGSIARKKTEAMKADVFQYFAQWLQMSGKRVRSIPRGLKIQGLGTIGIELSQWLLAAKGILRWEVRTGKHKRYQRMIVVRIAPDRNSIADFVYLRSTPETRCVFRITDKMLRDEPRGTAQEMAALLLADCK